MNGRALRWFVFLVVLLAIDLASTIHAHANFHRTPDGPSVMTLGQLLGWATSGVLLVAAACVLIGGINASRRERR